MNTGNKLRRLNNMWRITLVLLIFHSTAQSQDLDYASWVIESLTDKSMHGRGYVDNGHKIAADFISNEFKLMGLQSFSISYQQAFPLTVNTFPKKVTVKLGDQKLIPGEDFLINSSSPGINGQFTVLSVSIDSLLINNKQWIKRIKSLSSVLIIDKTGFGTLSNEDKQIINDLIDALLFHKDLTIPAVVLITDEKLTWSISSQVALRPLILIRKSVIEANDIVQIKLDIKNELREDILSQNVIGMIPGKRTDSIVMITAHYDHLGKLGKKTFFPGANDNASGVAMMLNLARHYSFNETPEFNTLFVAFGAEEVGLVGSQYYVGRPIYPLNKIKFLINLDLVGTGDDGATVVNGTIFNKEFNLLVSLNSQMKLLPELKSRGAECNSDHCPFFNENVPCFFIYTLGGTQAYHDIYDIHKTLPLTRFVELQHLVTAFLGNL